LVCSKCWTCCYCCLVSGRNIITNFQQLCFRHVFQFFGQHILWTELNSFPSFLHVKHSVYIFWYCLLCLCACYALEALTKVGFLLLHSCWLVHISVVNL
jgi:hypothetical protein